MELTYRTFLKEGIDLAPLDIEKSTNDDTYFCTPKGARIIGWAGVDGIHYCFIRGFGEMVFAVSPMNIAPHYVHPLARNFADFLRLLLACGGSAALEQAWQWDAGHFAEYLRENPPTQKQKIVLARIAEQTGLSPMEDPWQYLHELQSSFDYSKIQYTKEFYDLDLNPEVPQQAPEWTVTFYGDFGGNCGVGRAGKELEIHREFEWAGRHWIIPAAYLCGKGLVMDLCMRVEPSDIRVFMKKWDLDSENVSHQSLSEEQQMQMNLDNPLSLDFNSVLELNGKELRPNHGLGIAYDPCLLSEIDRDAKYVIDHYGLNPNFGWMIWRSCYPWATKRKPVIQTLAVTMIQEKVPRPGPRFQVFHPGDTVAFSYGGQEHVLTVQEYEAQTMDMSRMPQEGLEYPEHYMAMSYTVTPELPDGTMTLNDCNSGDRPRQVPTAPGQRVAVSCAVIGMVGGAGGRTSILYGEDKQGKLHAACSSLHFAPVEQVEWQMVFYEKQFENTTVDLIQP